MRPQVLLLTSRPGDPHVHALRRRLEQRGAFVSLFDPRDFPQRAKLSLGFAARESRPRLEWSGGELALAELCGVWWYKAERPVIAALGQAGDSAWAQAQAEALFDGVWEGLSCRVLPGPRHLVFAAELKARQLALAQRLGFSVPCTLISHQPEDFLRFYEQHGGRVIAKVLQEPRIARAEDDVRLAFTHVVERRDLLRFRSLSRAPTILQEYVPKQLELRLTVVGRQVFAAALHTQDSEYARDDSRHQDSSVRIESHALDTEVSRRCIALTAALGLDFSTLDLIVRPDGEHVFLEVNPAGQWWWIEERTGLGIAAALAQLLIQPMATDRGRHDAV